MNTKLRSIILLAGLVIAPSVAQAQFGGLIKKAKQTITRDTTTPKPDPVKTTSAGAIPVVTDEPVTSSWLDAMLKGFTAEIPVAQQVSAQLKLSRQLWAQETALSSPNDAVVHAYTKRDGDWSTCLEFAVRDAQQSHAGEIASKQMALMSDPTKAAAVMQDQQAAMQKSMALRAKGDTAGADAVMADMMKKMGVDLHADTVAAMKKCGARPQKPAVLVQIEDLRKRATAAEENARALEKRESETGAAAAGMSVSAWGYTQELQYRHLFRWWTNCRTSGSCEYVTPAENALFHSREADVGKVLALADRLNKIGADAAT